VAADQQARRSIPESDGWSHVTNVWIPIPDLPGIMGGSYTGDPLTEVSLPAGQYGIFDISCRNRRGLGSLHLVAPYRPSPRTGLKVPTPLAVFTVHPGEVVNIGTIVIVPSGDATFAHRVAPIPPELLAQFGTAKPNLAAPMVTRLMTIPPEVQSAGAAATAASGIR
jgi:hypothetical protein